MDLQQGVSGGTHTASGAADAGVLLAIDRASLSFGGIAALTDVSATVKEGGVTAIIGPNGAGKTTLFNVVSGFYRPQSGTVTFDGRNISALPVHGRAKLGIARTFQNIALFSGLTVLENIKLGSHVRLKANTFTSGLYLGGARREEEALTREIDEDVIGFLGLDGVRDLPTVGLPYGVLKRVELARALALRPRLMMLDEPVAGMTASEKRAMAEYIRRCVAERSTTVLLIDHDMETVMDLSDHVVVLNFGRVIAAGTAAEVRRNPEVINAYLGDE
jgi:branched-chain amino acid transport system ATP-binding protein